MQSSNAMGLARKIEIRLFLPKMSYKAFFGMLQQPQTQIALMTGQFGFHLFHPLPTSVGALEKLMTDGFSMGISFPPLFFCGSTTFISFRGK